MTRMTKQPKLFTEGSHAYITYEVNGMKCSKLVLCGVVIIFVIPMPIVQIYVISLFED